ncbi:MAG: Sodium, potassium, lithium and rubidium/H(+) antiporter [Chroococcidiopsis cubana SAG 39.79]|uniref:Na+/H+ antiporter n=1 Tax=Chroococcidiopsis cubana SAG 39.79 TaxID=388085 RepID=A0AB37U8Z7_9CYAN|nr:Na+/H+ antiporter [Chroococcidiopsis cubana]MDZ4879150.1 Sodium, potassium, lithium and rubidium/H(+) antiporter [Chroococcidiopsis cubana SAG 39.79]PSB65162.1 Na+/H+ antiporter [Chroococcidiopsis cubana CCALA 043]RUS98693.1 Na+/H+ antiporter [Chroococcidiopsis cubana SAG 39.79]
MHHEIEIILGLLLAVAALAVVAQRLAVPYPILLVIGGLVLGFIPGLPHVELNPELVFVLFLPPLLNSAAWYTSWRDFRFNLRPILLLAIGLVLATTFAVAAVAHLAIGGVTWATGFVLGAIVSPPDAVAATAITQRLNVPRRVVTVLEGESLINDATGLVAYRFAVAAVATGAFSLWEAGLRFFLMAIGGVLIGLAMGWIVVKIHSLMDDSLVEITSSILMCFLTYILAERLGVSGVLAVVTLGLYHRRKSPEVLSPRTRIQTIAVWDLIVFLLNGLIFILIGLQLPTILEEISEYSLATLVWYGILVSVVAIAVRLLWVYPAAYIPRFLNPKLRERDPYPSWRLLLLISWAGMRGVVSLAAALALPLTINNGAPFPNRDLILFLTFCVILVTLVLQGLTLPLLIRWLKIEDEDNIEREEMEGRLRAAEAALDRLDELLTKDCGQTEAELIQWLRTQYDQRIRSISACCVAIDMGSRERLTAFRRLQHEMLSAERRTAIQLRNQGAINDEVLHRIERDLDLEETRLGK